MTQTLDATTVAQIRQTVINLTIMGKLFTAWDVTKEVRKVLNPSPPHGMIKGVVHEMFADAMMPNYYDRALISLPGVSPDPFCYYPHGTDPQTDYMTQQTGGTVTPTPQLPGGIIQPAPRAVAVSPLATPPAPLSGYAGNTAPKATKPSVSALGARCDATNVNRAGETKMDTKGRILIPKKALASIGAQPYKPVYVKKDGDVLVITTTPQVGGFPLNVDKYLNVKVKNGVNASVYTLSGDGTKLEVKPK